MCIHNTQCVYIYIQNAYNYSYWHIFLCLIHLDSSHLSSVPKSAPLRMALLKWKGSQFTWSCRESDGSTKPMESPGENWKKS